MNIETLPSVPLNSRSLLPDRSGVYFAIDAAGSVVYIGRATSLLRRWQWHHRQFQLDQVPGVRIAWLLASGDIAAAERYFIQKFQPTLNYSPVDRINPETALLRKFEKATKQFLRFYDAVAAVNPSGATLIWNDFQVRQIKACDIPDLPWDVRLAQTMRLVQDALAEAATRGPELRVKALKAIEALQLLIAQEAMK